MWSLTTTTENDMRPRRQSTVRAPLTSYGDGDPESLVSSSPTRPSTRRGGVLIVLQKILCYAFLAGVIGLASIAVLHLLSIPWTVYGILTANKFNITVTLAPDAVAGFTDNVTYKYGRFLRSCGYLWYFLAFSLFIGLGLSSVVLLANLLQLSYAAWRNGKEEWLHPPRSVLERENRSLATELVIEYGEDLHATWAILTTFLFILFSYHRAAQQWAEGHKWDLMGIFGWSSKSVGITLPAIVVNLLVVIFLVVHFVRVYSEVTTPRSG